MPAGRSHQPAPGRSGHHAHRHYDRCARCVAGSGDLAGGHIRRVGQAATKPGPDRTKGQQHPLGRTAVERRQASAPDSGKGGASRPIRGAPCAPLAYGLRNTASAGAPLPSSFFVIASEAKQSICGRPPARKRDERMRNRIACIHMSGLFVAVPIDCWPRWFPRRGSTQNGGILRATGLHGVSPVSD